ncbi:hypothetical protein C8Q80DRAFT_1052939, partial [Daedaleopsis nitida]
GSSIFEARTSGGVDLDKLVIGKPVTLNDVSHGQRNITGGFIDPATLGTGVQQAVQGGWNVG